MQRGHWVSKFHMAFFFFFLVTALTAWSMTVADNPQLAMEMSETLNLAAKCNHINRAFPPVRRFLNSVPSSILVFLVPRLKAVVDLQVRPIFSLPSLSSNKGSIQLTKGRTWCVTRSPTS